MRGGKSDFGRSVDAVGRARTGGVNGCSVCGISVGGVGRARTGGVVLCCSGVCGCESSLFVCSSFLFLLLFVNLLKGLGAVMTELSRGLNMVSNFPLGPLFALTQASPNLFHISTPKEVNDTAQLITILILSSKFEGLQLHTSYWP